MRSEPSDIAGVMPMSLESSAAISTSHCPNTLEYFGPLLAGGLPMGFTFARECMPWGSCSAGLKPFPFCVMT